MMELLPWHAVDVMETKISTTVLWENHEIILNFILYFSTVKSNTMCLVNLFLNLLSEDGTISSGLQTTTEASLIFSLVSPKNTAALQFGFF